VLGLIVLDLHGWPRRAVGQPPRRQPGNPGRHGQRGFDSSADGAPLAADQNAVGTNRRRSAVAFLLWIAAVIIAIFGIIALVQGSILWGILLLVVAALIGPGGYSIFSRRGV
jgi:hypothetical protein